jgi:cytoskeletal protein RodZ
MSEDIGQKLRETRQGLDISLEQAAEETRIRLHYLQALESGDFSQLPSKAHEKGFLRAYSEYLGLESATLLTNLDQQEDPPLEIAISSIEEPVQKDTKTSKDSQVIFEDLGVQLRQQRELLGFSIEEVERNIHIREHYLEALERGDIEGLPSPVQGRGRRGMRLPFSGIFPGEWILRAVLILAVLAFVVWGVIQINSMQAALNPAETVPPIAEALQATTESESTTSPQSTEIPIQESTVEVGAPEEESELIPPAPEEIDPETAVPTESNAPVQVYVSVLRRAWMRVAVDGDIEFEGRVIPGGAYSFSGEFQIELLTGNGAGLQVFFNGEDLGVLGVYGEVVYEVFTPEGVLLPTPTSTPIPTDTPLASPTPPATSAP